MEGFDDALVLLIGEVAATYVELRALEQRLEVARENATLQNESVRVAQARLDAKAADSELDTPQAKANLGNTLAAVEAFEIQRRQAQNRLAVLMGMPPHDLSYMLDGPATIPQRFRCRHRGRTCRIDLATARCATRRTTGCGPECGNRNRPI